MIAKLVSAAAVIAAMASPALAGDFAVRSPAQPAYVERQDRVYVPGDVVAGVVGTPGAIVTAPLAPRRYVYPNDSYAHYDGPYATTGDGAYVSDGPYVSSNDVYVAPGTVRPIARGTYWVDPVGPVCEPGTLVRALDGRSYLCQ